MTEFLSKLFSIQENKPHHLGDPGLMQGARFNKMQHAITGEVMPQLYLMEQTTGVGLKSVKEGLTTTDSESYTKPLDQLDTSEVTKMDAMEKKYQLLINQLQTIQSGVANNVRQRLGGCPSGWKLTKDGTCEGPKGDDANYYEYKCSNGRSFFTYDASTLTDMQKKQIQTKWPNKPPAYYACNSGCAGTCTKGDANTFDNICALKHKSIYFVEPEEDKHPLCSSMTGDDDSQITSLLEQIQDVNAQLAVLEQQVAAQARRTNNANTKIGSTRYNHQQDLQTKMQTLSVQKKTLDNLLRQQHTLDGQLNVMNDDLDATYLQYIIWFVAVTTLGILTVKQLSK